jgi:hypothetical protein
MKGNKKNLAQKRVRRKRLELIIAGIGYMIGIGLGVWLIIQMLVLGISK